MKPCAALVLILAIVPCLPACLSAQDDSRGPDGQARVFVPGVQMLSIPDTAFSANSTILWTRTLEDGNTVVTELHSRLARDAQGRIHRESHTFVPVGSGKPSRLRTIDIYDPILRTETTCNPYTRHCFIRGYRPRVTFVVPAQGASPDGNSYLQREDLGPERIEGIDVTGSRETVTVRAGVAGNSNPLVTTSEFWYSPQLKTNLAVTRIDPKEGKQEIRLSDITISEPDPELFRIPSGYTIEDQRTPSPTR